MKSFNEWLKIREAFDWNAIGGPPGSVGIQPGQASTPMATRFAQQQQPPQQQQPGKTVMVNIDGEMAPMPVGLSQQQQQQWIAQYKQQRAQQTTQPAPIAPVRQPVDA